MRFDTWMVNYDNVKKKKSFCIHFTWLQSFQNELGKEVGTTFPESSCATTGNLKCDPRGLQVANRKVLEITLDDIVKLCL